MPAVLGGDWIKTLTAVAIYAVVAAGLVTLYGRVGMISLGQIALLAIGTWTATRISYAADLPFPILLLVTGAITCGVGVLIGLPALRLSGLYLALITLMAAGAVNVVLTTINFPNGGHGFTGPHLDPRPLGAAARRQARHRGGRHGLLPLHDRRLRAHVPADRRALRLEARARLGLDPRERARRARGGREHRPLQAVGLRAGLVHDRRGRRAARGAARSADGVRLSRRRTR